MVATVAFGMGINKSNVRFVVHYHLPKDLESYYQEIGRAGRDGLRADCLLLSSRRDATMIRRFIEQGAESERPGREARLKAVMGYAEARDCRRIPLLAYFGETLTQPCGHCDNCVRMPATGETRDVTVEARQFLSCVKRTGERFGPAHIIAVLRGSRSDKVLARGHDRLSTFGIGREHSTEEWRGLAREFIRQGLVDQDLAFGGLRLTAKGLRALEGETERVPLARPPVAVPRAAVEPAYDPSLFNLLRVRRKELADLAGISANAIFSDRTLAQMATILPQDEDQLSAIDGVSEAKLANYGETFLRAIREYCARNGLSPRPVGPSPPARPIVTQGRKWRSVQTGELFAAGHGIDEIAERYGVQRQTVLVHLHRFFESGGRVDPERLLGFSHLTEADRRRVFAAFEALGMERLAPVHEALGGAIGYDELYLLRLHVLCRGRNPSA